jgi:hypothetical protein
MMTLQLKKCVSLFVCLSLLLSACSSDKSSKAGEIARNEVKLAYDLCASKDEVIVKAEESITSIGEGEGEMKCTTENGKTTCTKRDGTKCKLKNVELCNELDEDCEDFKFDVTPVPCEPSDNSKGACRPMRLKGEQEKEKEEKVYQSKEQQQKKEPDNRESRPDNSNNGSPWYTSLATEVAVGIGTGLLIKKKFMKSTPSEALYAATGISAVAGGETARAVTTGFDMGAVGGGFAGAGAGIVTGGLMGGVVLPLVQKLLMGNTDGWLMTMGTGAIIGAVTGGISGIATGLESARWNSPSKLDNKRQDNKQ